MSLLRSTETGEVVARVPGLALMYTDSVLGAPPLLRNLVATWGSLPKNLVLVTVRRVRAVFSQALVKFCLPSIFFVALRCFLQQGLFTTKVIRCCEMFLPSRSVYHQVSSSL